MMTREQEQEWQRQIWALWRVSCLQLWERELKYEFEIELDVRALSPSLLPPSVSIAPISAVHDVDTPPLQLESFVSRMVRGWGRELRMGKG